MKEIGPDTEGWSLSVEHNNGTETQSLYHEGEIYSQAVFSREEGRLITRKELDAQGDVVSQVEYAYDQEGTPRTISTTFGNKNASSRYIETDSLVNPEGTFHRHSSGFGDDWRITESNRSGLPVSLDVFEDGELVEESSWIRNEDGVLREEIHKSENGEQWITYDSRGHIQEELLVKNDIVILVKTFFWTDENLVRVEERGDGQLIIREIQWSDDRKTSETRSENGLVTSRIEWSSPDDRVEILYRNEEAVLRVYWKGETRQREEFLQNDKVIRTREGGT